MASGKVHDQWIYNVSWALIGIAASDALRGFLSSRSIPQTAIQTGAIAFGCLLGGLFLSPDMDLPTSNPQRRWGPLSVLWIPYEASFKHRSFGSHGFIHNKRGDVLLWVPFVATAIRVAYLLFWIAAFTITYDSFTYGPFNPLEMIPPDGLSAFMMRALQENFMIVAWFFGGICIADAIHAFLDVFVKNREHSFAEVEGIRKGD